jgi:hypothetical protein
MNDVHILEWVRAEVDHYCPLCGKQVKVGDWMAVLKLPTFPEPMTVCELCVGGHPPEQPR